jgi:hypothetical protein
MNNTIQAPEQRTIDVDVGSLDTRGRTVHGYAAIYNQLRKTWAATARRSLPARSPASSATTCAPS